MTQTLAVIIIGLVFYGIIRDVIITCRSAYKRFVMRTSDKKTKELCPDDITRIIAAVILLSGFMWSSFRCKEFSYLLVLVLMVMYIVISVAAIGVVCTITLSKSNQELTKDENTALFFVGLLVGGMTLVVPLRKTIEVIGQLITGWKADIAQYSSAIFTYTVLFFFVVALAEKPLKDLARLVYWISTRLHNLIQVSLKWTAQKTRPLYEKFGFINYLLEKTQHPTGWKIIIRFFILAVAFLADIAGYVLRFLAMILIGILMMCMFVIDKFVEKILCLQMQKLIALSDRKVVVLSFRIAIISAMLFIVVANRYSPGTSESATSVLEFVASVVIIPVVIEWIHSALQGERKGTLCTQPVLNQTPIEVERDNNPTIS